MNRIIVFIILISACSPNKDSNQKTEEIKSDQIEVVGAKEQRTEQVDEMTLEFHQYYPQFNCTTLSGEPIDTLFNNSDIVGFIYKVNRQNLEPECLNYYSQRFFQPYEKTLPDTLFHSDSINDKLILKVGNRYDTLDNVNSEGEGSTKYAVQHYFDFLDSYLISKAGWEWYSYLLINHVNGNKIELRDTPKFNENKDLFLTDFNDDMTGGAHFSLYGVEKNTIIQLWSLDLSNSSHPFFFKPYRPIWISNRTILYKNLYDPNDNFYALKLITTFESDSKKMSSSSVDKIVNDPKEILYDSIFKIENSIIHAVGVVQSTGLKGDFKKHINASFQLITSRKPFFLFSDSDLAKYWGKCVKVTGKFPNEWDINTENINGVWTYGRSAIHIDSISVLLGSNCDIWHTGMSDSYNTEALRDTLYGTISRFTRYDPDISYDYKIDLIEDSILNPQTVDHYYKSIPMITNVGIDELNQLIEQRTEVLVIGYVVAGYAETYVFVADKIEKN